MPRQSSNNELEIVKKPYRKMAMSTKDIEEFAQCADPDNGYMYFLKNFYWIQHPVQGRILYEPYDFQVRMLEAYHKYKFVISMLPRQVGKTTSSAGYLLWKAMFQTDQTILIAAHKFTAAQEIMQRVRFGYELCPDHIKCGVVSYNKGSIEFENGSRIISATTTETTGRGMSISLLYMDELAYVPPNIAEAFWASISPTLSTGGQAIITSTPNTDEDLFANIWKNSQNYYDDYGNVKSNRVGINGFYGFRAYWYEHPDRDESWKQEQIAKLGEAKWMREYECEFIGFDETLIDGIRLSELKGREPEFKIGNIRWYKKPEPNQVYLAAIDPSMGTGSDFAAIEVFEFPSFIQVAEWQHNTTPVQTQIKLLRDILRFIASEMGPGFEKSIFWSCENNNIGESALIVIQSLGEDTFPGNMLSEPIKKGHIRKYRKGFNTTYNNKISACSRLKYLIEEGKMQINSIPLISELKAFVASGMSYRAKLGQHDDLVSAMLLVIRMSVVLSEWDPQMFETLAVQSNLEDDWEMPLPFFVV